MGAALWGVDAVLDKTFLSLASLSAACCAYMLGWRETLSRLVACGREERAQERLGRATRLLLRAAAANVLNPDDGIELDFPTVKGGVSLSTRC
jgi:threonine/homoserine/homoserine lactone efflux protein